MKVQADGFEFEFPGALDAFVFDDKLASSPHYHGLSHAMKAVDLVVELPADTLFIEVKDFHAPDDYDFRRAISRDAQTVRRQRLNQRVTGKLVRVTPGRAGLRVGRQRGHLMRRLVGQP